MRGVGFEPTTALRQRVSPIKAQLLEPAALDQARRPPHNYLNFQ